MNIVTLPAVLPQHIVLRQIQYATKMNVFSAPQWAKYCLKMVLVGLTNSQIKMKFLRFSLRFSSKTLACISLVVSSY